MTEASGLLKMAGDIGQLKGQLEGVQNTVAGVKKDVSDLDTKFTEKFDDLATDLQEIKKSLGIRKGRMSMLKDIGLMGWAFISVCLMGFGNQMFTAATWLKTHLPH